MAKVDLKFLVEERNHGNKKELDVQELVQIDLQSGEKVDMYLLLEIEIIHSKLIEKKEYLL